MDYFQGVVENYLRANRATFINAECCIQLNDAENPDISGPHWYCDALAVNVMRSRAYLCEISFAQRLGALRERLSNWKEYWPLIRRALARDCGIPLNWTVRPWVFVPKDLCQHLDGPPPSNSAKGEDAPEQMPHPKITFLEDVMPWKYRSWNRPDDDHP
jgi:hypothetical protein